MNKFLIFFLVVLLPNFVLAFQKIPAELDTTIVQVEDVSLYQFVYDALEKNPNADREKFVLKVFGFDEDGNENERIIDQGIVYRYLAEDIANLIYQVFHKDVLQTGGFLFLSNIQFDQEYNIYWDVVILPGTDPYKIIKDMGVMAVNYDLYNEDIIEKLKEWDAEYGLNFETIQNDNVAFYFDRLPKDLKAFAAEIYDFCPDAIDQGVGSQKALIKNLKKFKYLYLWWD